MHSPPGGVVVVSGVSSSDRADNVRSGTTYSEEHSSQVASSKQNGSGGLLRTLGERHASSPPLGQAIPLGREASLPDDPRSQASARPAAGGNGTHSGFDGQQQPLPHRVNERRPLRTLGGNHVPSLASGQVARFDLRSAVGRHPAICGSRNDPGSDGPQTLLHRVGVEPHALHSGVEAAEVAMTGEPPRVPSGVAKAAAEASGMAADFTVLTPSARGLDADDNDTRESDTLQETLDDLERSAWDGWEAVANGYF